jgi:uncharacterized protein YlxP (DUF503 family)
MSFLANGTIVAPTLYTTDTDSATAYKTAVDTLINERDTIIQNKVTAEARAEAITKEIEVLKRQLNITLDKSDRTTIKASIVTLETEQEDVWDVMGIKVAEVMEDRITALGIPALQAAALTERNGWFVEINTYSQALRDAFNDSLRDITAIVNTNIYKTSTTNLENLERFISDNR